MENNSIMQETTTLRADLEALLPAEGQTYYTGRRGRPVTKATFAALAGDYKRFLPEDARRLAEAYPYETIEILAAARRELTPDEIRALSATRDAQFQGTYEGEPEQRETRATFNVSVMEGQSFREALEETAEIAMQAGVLLARRCGQMVTVRYERWAVARPARDPENGTAASRKERLPKSLEGLPARYQGVIYVSDAADKLGFLTLARVFPTGQIQRLARSENSFATAQELVPA